MSARRKSKTTALFDHSSETAKDVFNRLANDKNSYTTRAEDCAKYTIPSIFPIEGSNGSTNFDTPYQSLGARGVNNLASKLMLALFPPNDTFFRLSVDDELAAKLAQNPEAKDEIETELSRLEQIAMQYAEAHQYRVTLAEALKVLVVTGNCLLFLPPKEGGMKLYKLRDYCVQRDALGNVVQIVTLDKIAYAALPDDVKKMVTRSTGEKKPEDVTEIYTHCYLDGDVYRAYQEVDGEIVPKTEQEFPKDKSPWIPLRMVKMDGESYGRSFVEEYLGDLKSLESLSKSIVEMSAIAANVIFLVNPNGVTRVRSLTKAQSGSFVAGRADDIHPMQLEKYADLQVAQQTIAMLTERLSYAFMLNSAVQRNGERVTAEEIRYVASELEDTLGGVYSILAQELQLPLVKRLMVQLQLAGLFPQIEDLVEPTITTGLAAIGRGHDLQNLMTFMQLIGQTPEAMQTLNANVLMQRIASSLGVDTTNLIKTPEQIQQEQQQAYMMKMSQQMAPQVAKGMMDAQNQPASNNSF
jgi:hypothetical protein